METLPGHRPQRKKNLTSKQAALAQLADLKRSGARRSQQYQVSALPLPLPLPLPLLRSFHPVHCCCGNGRLQMRVMFTTPLTRTNTKNSSASAVKIILSKMTVQLRPSPLAGADRHNLSQPSDQVAMATTWTLAKTTGMRISIPMTMSHFRSVRKAATLRSASVACSTIWCRRRRKRQR